MRVLRERIQLAEIQHAWHHHPASDDAVDGHVGQPDSRGPPDPVLASLRRRVG